MIKGQLFSITDIKRLIAHQTGDLDFVFDSLVYLNSADLAAIEGVTQDYMYFGDLVIESISPFSTQVVIQNTLHTHPTVFSIDAQTFNTPPQTNASIIRGFMWNRIEDYVDVSAHFIGYKFVRNTTVINSDFTVVTVGDWTQNGTVYTHETGNSTTIGLTGSFMTNNLPVTLIIDFTGITDGICTVSLDNTGQIGEIASNGQYQFTFNPAPGDENIIFGPDNDFDGSFDTSKIIIRKTIYA